MNKNITVYAGWKKVPESTEIHSGDSGDITNSGDKALEESGDTEKTEEGEHYAYIIGYPDGTVDPVNNITRAEVATIFFRLLKEEIRNENIITVNKYNDVNEGEWYNTAISTLTKLNILNGKDNNSFGPNDYITRAEFTAICTRFFEISNENTENKFTDVKGHWAEVDINKAAAAGLIKGYEDNTFRPDNLITRAEAITLTNRVLTRVPETEADLLEDMITWPDNAVKNAWYYLAIQEATNSHYYVRKENDFEKWTGITSVKDWTIYEK